MEITYTDGTNRDFICLCRELDDHFNRLAGGEENRKEYVQHNLLSDIHDVFVIYESNTPVGCAAFKYYSEGIAEVKRVYIKPGFRGRGLSKMLMDTVEQKAREEGYKTLILETGKSFDEAVGLYSGIGYTVIDNYGQYRCMPESVCMQKDIS